MEGLNLSKKQFAEPEDFQGWAKKVADYQASTQGAATPPPAPSPSEPTNVPTIPLPPMLPPERSSQIRQQYGY